jgi:hypothetical protein
LTLDRAEREVETVAEEAGERRVAAEEGGVCLTERPDRPRQPVRRSAVGRVGEFDGFGARVQRAVGLHPQHHVLPALGPSAVCMYVNPRSNW